MSTVADRARLFVDWFLRSRVSGKLTLAQFPNTPLWVFVTASVARLIVHPSGAVLIVLSLVSTSALVVWAVIEVGWGVNPFRRIVGVVVLIAEIAVPALSVV